MTAVKRLNELGEEDIIVVERMSGEAFDHYHRTCGEAISEYNAKRCLLDDSFTIRPVNKIIMTFGDVIIDIPAKGRVIDRVALLNSLRMDSRAVYVNDQVLSVKESDGGYEVECGKETYHCEYLIGADGAFSRVRDNVFGVSPYGKFPIVNNIVEDGNEDTFLHFEIVADGRVGYRWDFPSRRGYRSVGYIKGMEEIDDSVERGVRFGILGKLERVINGNSCIVGDAAILANPLRYGGIAAALLSGRKAAEAISKGNMQDYQRWYEHEIMFNRHFLKARFTISKWGDEEYADAIRPLKGGYSLLRGGYAILRRPKWANVYMSIWIALLRSW